MTKVTLRQLLEYNTAASRWMMKGKDNADTKLGYAIQRMADRYTKAIKAYTNIIKKADEDIEDLRQDFQKEEGGKLVWDMVKEGNKEARERAYSKADAKTLTKKIREIQEKVNEDLESLLNDETKNTVEIEPRFATSIPVGLTDFEKEAFAGIVIDPDMLNKSVEHVVLNGHSKETVEA